MRILLLTDRFAPHLGGTAQLYYQWAQRISDIPVRVVTRSYRGARQLDAGARYSIVRLPFLDIPKIRMPLLWLFIFGVAFFECFRKRQRLVIHAGQILETGVSAYILSRIFSVPYVIHVFGEEINHYSKRGFTRKLMKAVLGRASAVTSISQYTSVRLRELDLFHGPVTLVRPAVDLSRFQGRGREATRKTLGLEGCFVLLTVSRLMKRKGHDTVIEALVHVLSCCPDVVYLIAGSGTQESRLKSLAVSLKVDHRVRFLGAVAPEELEGLYSASDVFVHPNREVDGDIEGFGMVFLEANACRVPVIGGNSGGAPDAIQHGVSGYLVNPDSVEELACLILRLKRDQALRTRMGEAGPAWASRFSWDEAVHQVKGITMKIGDAS